MLVPRRPRRALSTSRVSRVSLPPRAPGARSTNDVRREEQFLAWLAELVHLTEIEGRATARLWYERLRKPDGLPRSSSDRQWERLKGALVEHGVPHELGAVPASDDAGEAPGAVTIKVLVSKTDLDKYRQRRKKCKAPTCGAWLPPRTPFFHRDPTRPDGLSRRCAACENAAAAARAARGMTAPLHSPEHLARLEARRATWRVSSARRRRRFGAVAHAESINLETPRGLDLSRDLACDKSCARTAVARAIKAGHLVRPECCSGCGCAGKIQAHHRADYEPRDWLNVEWLCSRCHRSRHGVNSHETERGLSGGMQQGIDKDRAGGAA